MLLTIVAFVFAILLLVSLHELGHLLIARLCGVKVLRFSVGFGKPLWQTRWRNIDWCLAPIPLGGYVKMVDTREGEVAPQDLPFAFDKQHPLKRIAIVVAGPLTNLLLAILLYTMALSMGVTEVKPVIGTIISPAIERSGLESGDTILSIDGNTVKSFSDVRIQLVMALDKGTAVIVARKPTGQEKTYYLESTKDPSLQKAVSQGRSFGFIPDKLTLALALVSPDSPAQKAGLKKGDVLSHINGQPINNWLMVSRIIRKSPGVDLNIDYIRDGKEYHTVLRPVSRETGNDALPLIGYAGIAPLPDRQWEESIRHTYYPTIFQSASLAWSKTIGYSGLTLKLLGKMITGQASLDHISGPISIAQSAGQTASMGLQTYLSFLAVVSLSLGVMNLLPIPVLDGGHLLYYVVEWIRGKPLSERVQLLGLKLGIIVLLGFMCIAFFNDFSRLFG